MVWKLFCFLHKGLLYIPLGVFLFTMVQQPPVGQGLLIIEDSRSHSDTPQSVGLLWTSGQPDAETSTWEHTTLKKHRLPCPRRYSNPRSQQASGRKSPPYTSRPLGSAPGVLDSENEKKRHFFFPYLRTFRIYTSKHVLKLEFGYSSWFFFFFQCLRKSASCGRQELGVCSEH